MSSERHGANGTVLLGVWKALRVMGAFVGRGMEVVLRCIYVQLDEVGVQCRQLNTAF